MVETGFTLFKNETPKILSEDHKYPYSFNTCDFSLFYTAF